MKKSLFLWKYTLMSVEILFFFLTHTLLLMTTNLIFHKSCFENKSFQTFDIFVNSLFQDFEKKYPIKANFMTYFEFTVVITDIVS